MTLENSVPIQFSFYSDILDDDTNEIIQGSIADKEKDYYIIESIPFYAPKVAVGDTVWAMKMRDGEALTYRKTIEFSGNSTIHAVVMDDKMEVDFLQKIFEEMGCGSAKLNYRYFALNIPVGIDYIPVKRKLDELEKNRTLGYAESCLSEKHQYKNHFFRKMESVCFSDTYLIV